jgi:hypothetical protein
MEIDYSTAIAMPPTSSSQLETQSKKKATFFAPQHKTHNHPPTHQKHATYHPHVIVSPKMQ